MLNFKLLKIRLMEIFIMQLLHFTNLPTLFNIPINDLARKLKELELCGSLGNTLICIRFFADDIVLVSENEQYLQKMLDHVCY